MVGVQTKKSHFISFAFNSKTKLIFCILYWLKTVCDQQCSADTHYIYAYTDIDTDTDTMMEWNTDTVTDTSMNFYTDINTYAWKSSIMIPIGYQLCDWFGESQPSG